MTLKFISNLVIIIIIEWLLFHVIKVTEGVESPLPTPNNQSGRQVAGTCAEVASVGGLLAVSCYTPHSLSGRASPIQWGKQARSRAVTNVTGHPSTPPVLPSRFT